MSQLASKRTTLLIKYSDKMAKLNQYSNLYNTDISSYPLRESEKITPKKSLKTVFLCIYGFFSVVFFGIRGVESLYYKGSPLVPPLSSYHVKTGFILSNVNAAFTLYCSPSLHYSHFIVKTRYTFFM